MAKEIAGERRESGVDGFVRHVADKHATEELVRCWPSLHVHRRRQS
jgi:hypothetical protein